MLAYINILPEPNFVHDMHLQPLKIPKLLSNSLCSVFEWFATRPVYWGSLLMCSQKRSLGLPTKVWPMKSDYFCVSAELSINVCRNEAPLQLTCLASYKFKAFRWIAYQFSIRRALWMCQQTGWHRGQVISSHCRNHWKGITVIIGVTLI